MEYSLSVYVGTIWFMLTPCKDWGGVIQAAARAILREWEETLYYVPSNVSFKGYLICAACSDIKTKLQ